MSQPRTHTGSTRDLAARRRSRCGCSGALNPCMSCEAYELGVLDGAEAVIENLNRGLTCTCPDHPEQCEAHAHLMADTATEPPVPPTREDQP